MSDNAYSTTPQSIRSGKSAAPSMPLVDCFSAVANTLQGQKSKRVAKGLNALAGLEKHIKYLTTIIDEQRATIELQKEIKNTLKLALGASEVMLDIYRARERGTDESTFLQ